jgi:hypothetical protein
MSARRDASALALRFSPGFTITVRGKALPLRALSQLDGFGRLGLFLVYSAHKGPEALRPWMADHMDDESCERYKNDPLVLARRPGDFIWATMTEPMHDPGDRAAAWPTVIAVTPGENDVEAAAMVRAGIIRPLGRVSRNLAPMFEVLGIDSWETYEPTSEGESESEAGSEGDADPEPWDAGAAARAAGGSMGSAAGGERCAACGAAPQRLLRCTGTCGGAARYCGRDCQVSHWAEHKKAPCCAVKKQEAA